MTEARVTVRADTSFCKIQLARATKTLVKSGITDVEAAFRAFEATMAVEEYCREEIPPSPTEKSSKDVKLIGHIVCHLRIANLDAAIEAAIAAGRAGA